MTYLATFFTCLFANNVLLQGKGVNFVSDASKTKKGKALLFFFYLLAAVIVGFVAYGYSMFLQWLPGKISGNENLAWLTSAASYIEPVVFVLTLAIVLGIFFALIQLSPKLKEEIKPESLGLLLNTSLFAIALSILALASSHDILLIVVNVFGLPAGYLLSAIIFEPVLERIQASNASKGFKGAPLMLVTMAGMCLCFASLAF